MADTMSVPAKSNPVLMPNQVRLLLDWVRARNDSPYNRFDIPDPVWTGPQHQPRVEQILVDRVNQFGVRGVGRTANKARQHACALMLKTLTKLGSN